MLIVRQYLFSRYSKLRLKQSRFLRRYFAEVPRACATEATRADILWHSREGMTAHYSVAQVVEIQAALKLITDERHANNISPASIIAQQRTARVPSEVPAERKTA